MGILSFAGKPVNQGQQGKDVFVRELLHALDGLLNQNRFRVTLIEKCRRGDTEVFTDIEEFFDGRFGFAIGDIMDIIPAMAQIQAHLVFRNTHLLPQFRDPIANKLIFHELCTSLPNSIILSVGEAEITHCQSEFLLQCVASYGNMIEKCIWE